MAEAYQQKAIKMQTKPSRSVLRFPRIRIGVLAYSKDGWMSCSRAECWPP
jgi:hypothetical protein